MLTAPLVLDVRYGRQCENVISFSFGSGFVPSCHGRVDPIRLVFVIPPRFKHEAVRVFTQPQNIGRVTTLCEDVADRSLDEIQWCSDRRNETDHELRMLRFLRWKHDSGRIVSRTLVFLRVRPLLRRHRFAFPF